MLGERIKMFRCARGLSQDALVDLMGGLVTKQSVSKYERGEAIPLPRVLNRIASALNVKASQLWSQPSYGIQFVAYRKGSGLKRNQQEQIESVVKRTLEDWMRLSELTGGGCRIDIPVKKMKIRSFEDVENSAESIRKKWNLGIEPISSVTGTLESKNIFVIEVDTEDDFDGISAYATDQKNNVVSAAVASKKDVCGERQRLNLTHELGHLLLDVADDLDEEKTAFQFGSALLAPKEAVFCEVGSKRNQISLEELFILKKKFGLSIQALIHRVADLRIISPSTAKSYFMLINKLHWKKREPQESPPEKPQWLAMNVYKALSENLMSLEKAESLLGEKLSSSEFKASNRMRSFMRLPKGERDKILSEQAKKYRSEAETNKDWLDMGEGYES